MQKGETHQQTGKKADEKTDKKCLEIGMQKEERQRILEDKLSSERDKIIRTR